MILKKFERVNYPLLALKYLITIIHPNILFFREQYISEKTYNGSDVFFSFKRNFNEYLYIIQVTWLFLQYLDSLCVNTNWHSDQSDRIVRMVGFRLSNLFVFKCLMKENKKVTVSIILCSTILYFTIILTIVESPLFYFAEIDSGYKAFIYPSISFWNTFITLFTIGYGDLNVVTYLGRFFVGSLTILSGIILSFVTVAMTSDFDFED